MFSSVFFVFMIDAYRVLLCLSIRLIHVIIYLLSSVFNISCGQMSMINIALSINWCDFIFFSSLSLAVSLSKYLHQTTDDCMYTIHFTTLHHYYTYLSSLSKLCFPRIIFFFFSGFVHSLHSLEVFSVQLLIIKLIESMHCFLWFNWDAMQWPQFPFVLNIIFGLILKSFNIFKISFILSLISTKFFCSDLMSFVCMYFVAIVVVQIGVYDRFFYLSILLYLSVSVSLFPSDFSCLFVCLQNFFAADGRIKWKNLFDSNKGNTIRVNRTILNFVSRLIMCVYV